MITFKPYIQKNTKYELLKKHEITLLMYYIIEKDIHIYTYIYIIMITSG